MYNQMPFMMPGMMGASAPAANALGASALGGTSKIGSLLGKINLASILTNTQKTLNVVNQAIPLYYQVKPIFKNMKTLGKIGKEFTNINNNSNNNINNNVINNNTSDNINQENMEVNNNTPLPTFFL